MGFRRRTPHGSDYLADAMTLLVAWQSDGGEIYRTLSIDDTQHAALAERIQVFAEALQVRPRIRRHDGQTRIGLDATETGRLSESEVNLAARIEDAYRSITGLA